MRRTVGLILLALGIILLIAWALLSGVVNGVVILILILTGSGMALILTPPKLPPYRRNQ